MTLSSADHRELQALLSALREKQIENQQSARLKDYLRHSGDARQLYLEHFYLSSMLRWLHDDPMVEVAACKEPSTGAPLRKVRRSFGWQTALVAGCFYSMFALLAWNLRPDVNPANDAGTRQSTTTNRSVGVLVEARNCLWDSDKPLRRGDAVPLGTVKLDQGKAKFKLANGVMLTIEAPVECDLRSSAETYLQRGRLVARVPRQATGFTVGTATATLVDLGTEFAVEADEHGATEVRVIDGKVELRPNAGRNGSSSAGKPITLVKGDARRIESDGPSGRIIVRDVARRPGQPAQLLSGGPVRQIAVEGAFASSTYPSPDADVQHLIRGDGLNGDRHSATFAGTMWHSDIGHVKNEFVLFDLARPHRLESMKVWNFNSIGAVWRGVKQADIYVSLSGKGDPLSQPTDWKLVVADQQFAPGTGTDDYATPTVVPLGNVDARYAAIVIDEVIENDPRDKPEPNCAGLSEVQFFGERVLSKERPVK